MVGDKLTVGTPANHETVTIAATGAASPAGATVDVHAGARPRAPQSRVRRRTGNGPRPGGAAEVHTRGQPAVQREGNRDQRQAGDGVCALEQRAGAAARHRYHARQPAGQGSCDRRGRARRRGHDRGLPGDAGAQPVVRRPRRSPMPPAALVLRDAAGLVADSLNYGLLVDPWASEGYHGKSGSGEAGCRVPAPGPGRGGRGGPAAPVTTPHRSAGRFPDGRDTDSNCADFQLQPATTHGGRIGRRRDEHQSRQRRRLRRRPVDHDRHGREPRDRRDRDGRHCGRHHDGRRHRCGRDRDPCRERGRLQRRPDDHDRQRRESSRRRSSPPPPSAAAAAAAPPSPSPRRSRSRTRPARRFGQRHHARGGLDRPHASGTPVAGDVPTPGAPNKYSNRRR